MQLLAVLLGNVLLYISQLVEAGKVRLSNGQVETQGMQHHALRQQIGIEQVLGDGLIELLSVAAADTNVGVDKVLEFTRVFLDLR